MELQLPHHQLQHPLHQAPVPESISIRNTMEKINGINTCNLKVEQLFMKEKIQKVKSLTYVVEISEWIWP